jgi:dipeptidyl aminopeptidase/acylaminoacyl peptidase
MEPGTTQLYLVSAEGGVARQLTTGNYRHGGPLSWTPDGQQLLFGGNRSEEWEYDFDNSELYSYDLRSGGVRPLTSQAGPDRDATVAPNGKLVAFTGYPDQQQTYQISRLYVMNPDGSGRREITTGLDRSVSDPVWAADGSGLYVQYNDRGDTKLGFIPLTGGNELVATNLGGATIGRPYSGGSFSVAKNGKVAYTHGVAERPAELAVISRGGGKPTIHTSLNADLLPHRRLGELTEVNYPSTVDGRNIQGWVVTPPNFDPGAKYPLLVENHGGPISNYGPWFSPEVQLYAAAGYVVFYPNPRGSTGYGETFGNLLYHNYPGDDYQDVMDGVDYLLQRPYLSEDSLYVTGGSAGGIMSAWMIGKNNRFEAAAVVKPVVNWISKTLVADNYYGYANTRYPGQPWENPEIYYQFSPLSLVANIQTPTLVMVGTADLRTPLSEAKQLYHALKLRRVPTMLVEIPGSYHNIANRPSQLITKVDHVLAWFDRYRGEGE